MEKKVKGYSKDRKRSFCLVQPVSSKKEINELDHKTGRGKNLMSSEAELV